MTFDIGYGLGVAAANSNPEIIEGYTTLPAFKGSVKKRNLFNSGFVHGFRSIANRRSSLLAAS
jgi:hypothetical protein